MIQRQAAEHASGWTSAAIHDTVAKIAAESKFGTSPRSSLFDRLFDYLLDRLGDLIHWFKGRLDARIMLYAVIALALFIIVARIIVERQVAEARRLRGSSRGLRGVQADHWVIAAAEAANGRYAEACYALYAAVLDSLASDATIKLHASKTSGDYGRELRRAEFARLEEYRAFVGAFDRAVFGLAAPALADYARVRDAAGRVVAMREAA